MDTILLQRLETARREYVDRALWLPDEVTEDAQRRKRAGSQFQRLLDELTHAALTKISTDPTITEDGAEELLNDAVSIAKQIRSTFHEEDWKDPHLKWHLWTHHRSPLEIVRAKKVPYISRSELEQAASQYLNSPLRLQRVDRLLIDSLIAAELFAFADEMINSNPYARNSSPIRQPHAVWTYSKSQFANLVFLGGVSLVAIWLNAQGVIGDSLVTSTVVVSCLLLLASFLLSTFSLPFVWRKQANARSRLSEMIAEMDRIYGELATDGVVSARHIRDMINKAANSGVVWPPTLFAVLDDVVSRSGRF